VPAPGLHPRWAVRLLLAGASFLLVFAGLEAAVRLVSPGQIAPAFRALFMPDERMGYRLRPGAAGRYETPEFATDIAINAAGVRDDRELGPKPPGEFRIAVLGDSMVMAVQVPLADTFVRRLEDRLNGGGARRYRVINAGVQGYGTVEQWLFFRHVVSAFEPDLVLLTVFVGNDAVESAAAAHRLREGGATGAAAPADGGSSVPLWARRIARRSAAVQFLRVRLLAAGPVAALPLRERGVESYALDPPEEVLRGFEASRDAARRIADEATAAGARAAVLFLPARFQLIDRDFADLSAEVRPGGVRLDRDGASRRFLAAYAGIDVPQLDLLPRFRREANPAALYFGRNIHLTARGHEVAAEAIEAFVRAEGLVPVRSRTGS
jgi:hypothetical protein